MEIEEFSFPAITESRRFCIDSPPLWHVSSTPSSPAASRHEEAEASPETSLSEEKMDKLWEEFNEEELQFKGKKQNPNCEFDSVDHCSKDMVKFGCVKPFLVSKCNKSGVVSLLKVLRKMFLIHNKQRKLKKQHHAAR